MNGKAFIVGVVMLVVGIGSGYYVGQAELKEAIMLGQAGGSMNAKQVDFCRGFVRLWSDHVIWTRDYIVAAVADMPDVSVAAARLMRNQEDLGAAIVPYYGQDAGNKLTALLKEHIAIAVDLIKAAKVDDQDTYKAADEKWHTNAREIAQFLSSANPNWPYAALEKMMYEHLKVTTAEVVARLGQDWEGDVKAFDEVFTQILMMAKDLAMGIMKQFPDKF